MEPTNSALLPVKADVPVYLRLKRTRHETDAEDDGPSSPPDGSTTFPPLVKLKWDTSEMGKAPFPTDGQRHSSGDKSHRDKVETIKQRSEQALVFRRVAAQVGAASDRLTRRVCPTVGAPDTTLRVTGVKRFRDGVVVECTEGTATESNVNEERPTACSSSGRENVSSDGLYLLVDPGAPRTVEGSVGQGVRASRNEFHWEQPRDVGNDLDDEFNFDELTIDEPRTTAGVDTEPPLTHPGDAADESLPTFTLRATKRQRREGSVNGSSNDGIEVGEVWGWGEVTDASEVLLEDWVRETMPLLSCMTDAAARAEAQADMYCYPDHRHDDEYDSNAEDFSGNDYPEDGEGVYDEDEEHPDMDDDSCTQDEDEDGHARRRARGDDGAYGFYDESGYRERPLGRGWGSEDDEDDVW